MFSPSFDGRAGDRSSSTTIRHSGREASDFNHPDALGLHCKKSAGDWKHKELKMQHARVQASVPNKDVIQLMSLVGSGGPEFKRAFNSVWMTMDFCVPLKVNRGHFGFTSFCFQPLSSGLRKSDIRILSCRKKTQ